MIWTWRIMVECELPFYVTAERKPESGAEIHSGACGKSAIILRLLFEKCVPEIKKIQ